MSQPAHPQGAPTPFEPGAKMQAVPAMACKVVDWATQAHGGGGTSHDVGLAHAYAMARALRLADGPDELHRRQLGKMDLKKSR